MWQIQTCISLPNCRLCKGRYLRIWTNKKNPPNTKSLAQWDWFSCALSVAQGIQYYRGKSSELTILQRNSKEVFLSSSPVSTMKSKRNVLPEDNLSVDLLPKLKCTWELHFTIVFWSKVWFEQNSFCWKISIRFPLKNPTLLWQNWVYSQES